MNISATTILMSILLPLFLVIVLIWGTKRGSKALFFSITFLVGGLISLALTTVINYFMFPIESLIAGEPGSIRACLSAAFLTAALSEELARFLIIVLWIIAVRNQCKQEAIVTCGMIGLGFAMYENFLYSLTATSETDVIIGRAFPSFLHGADALIMGWFLARALINDQGFKIWPFFLALSVPLLLHGFYDFAAFLFEVTELPEEPTRDDLRLFVLPLAIILLSMVIVLIELVWSGWIVFWIRKSPLENSSDEQIV